MSPFQSPTPQPLPDAKKFGPRDGTNNKLNWPTKEEMLSLIQSGAGNATVSYFDDPKAQRKEIVKALEKQGFVQSAAEKMIPQAGTEPIFTFPQVERHRGNCVVVIDHLRSGSEEKMPPTLKALYSGNNESMELAKLMWLHEGSHCDPLINAAAEKLKVSSKMQDDTIVKRFHEGASEAKAVFIYLRDAYSSQHEEKRTVVERLAKLREEDHDQSYGIAYLATLQILMLEPSTIAKMTDAEITSKSIDLIEWTIGRVMSPR